MPVRHYYSIAHIQAAALFARRSWALESTYDGTYTIELGSENKAYTTAAVFSAVAFLEAAINEIFADAKDDEFGGCPGDGLSRQTIGLMTGLWNLESFERRAAILEKYQVALQLAEVGPFDAGAQPYQDVKLLINLRNILTHYKPQTVYEMEEEELEGQLGGKFPTSRIVQYPRPFFPNNCLGHGCAEWSVNSVLSFADDFFTKLGLERFHRVRSRNLTTR